MMSQTIASPSVRALARKKGLDIDQLAAKLGRQTIGLEDLSGEQPLSSMSADMGQSYWAIDHSHYGPVTSEPMSRFAKLAAKNLAAAQTLIPSVTHHDQANIEKLEAFRATLKQEAKTRGIRLTALAFQVMALGRALKHFPKFNSSLSEDGETIVLKQYVHIGIAVDTEHGLMVPVIRDVDKKGLWQIASEIMDLASRAQQRKIGPDQMGGASMTVTNLGGIGGTAFTPIVNPPEVAILGVTRSEIKPVWDGETFQPAQMLPFDLSYDHRVINGADAARFMSYFVGQLEDPRKILV